MISKFSARTGIAIVASCAALQAGPVKTQVFSKTELVYAGDVSSSDLLHGLTATTTGTWTGNGAGAAKLNDGAHGNTASVDSAGSVAWASPGATATFTLGNGNGFGWNVTSIQSIAAWVSVGFGNQAFTVSVRYKGDSTFTPLPDLSVDYQPLTTGANPDPGATKVTITDNAGPLISGIDAIRFTAQSVNGGLNSGRFTFREIDVHGVPATGPADADGDGTSDAVEINAGTNPADPDSFPMPPLRIMPVGDSITAGYTDNPTWNEPFNFGYRSGLYTRLKNAGYQFQFVGGSPQPWNNQSGDPTRGNTVFPALDLRTFGQDYHEGYGGTNISATEGRMANAIQTYDPDLILLMIGINGISTGSPAALASLINTTFNANPDVRVIVAQITPSSSYNANLFNYNTYIRETLVPSVANNGFRISTVDMYSMFLTNPADPTSINAALLANGINHPTNAVYDQMAQVWFDGIGGTGIRNRNGPTVRIARENDVTFNLRWAGKSGKRYTIRSSTDLSAASGNWPIYRFISGLSGTPPENSVSFPMPAEPRRFFVVEEWDQ